MSGDPSVWPIKQQALRWSIYVIVYILYCTNTATSLKFISSCPASVCQASGKREIFIPNDFKARKWEEIRNLGLENHNQILEETRIQPSFIGKQQTQDI